MTSKTDEEIIEEATQQILHECNLDYADDGEDRVNVQLIGERIIAITRADERKRIKEKMFKELLGNGWEDLYGCIIQSGTYIEKKYWNAFWAGLKKGK